MNFRATARTADLSTDLAMDPSAMEAKDGPVSGQYGQPDPQSDGADPATPGGPSPFNGAPPFGEPATTDPEWLDPKTQVEGQPDRGTAIPHETGPHVDQTTLHDARRRSYEAKAARYGR